MSKRKSDDSGPSRFDRRIDTLGKTVGKPQKIVEAAIYVNDTMELAWMVATEVFGDDATADAAIAIYDRIDRERQRLAATESDEGGD